MNICYPTMDPNDETCYDPFCGWCPTEYHTNPKNKLKRKPSLSVEYANAIDQNALQPENKKQRLSSEYAAA